MRYINSHHESNATQPPATQAIQANDPHCTQAVAYHRWSDSAIKVRAKDSQPIGTHIQNWPSRTVETDASQPRWAVCHPGSPCPGQSVPSMESAPADECCQSYLDAFNPFVTPSPVR
ncbi:hypothetical protein MTO96_015971 [Rhipicephalus appendiculatus]